MLAAEEFRNKDHIMAYLAEAYVARDVPSLHCFAFLLDKDATLGEAIELAQRRGVRAVLTRKSGDLFQLGIRVRTSYQTGYLVQMGQSWVFLSDGETSRLNSTIRAFARSTFPLLVRAFLPSSRILRLIERLKVKYDRVLVSEGTIYTKGQTSRVWKEGLVEFSAREMDRVARRDDGKWTNISFRCVGAGTEAFSCRVYEHGHLTLYSGRFPLFYSDVVLPYFGDASEIENGLREKERRDTAEGVVLNPVTVQFAKDISDLDMELLKDRILREYVAAVTHPGNPLLMIQLSDRLDGSAYDLYAYGQKVEIVPQQRASAQSLLELVSTISDVLPTGMPVLD